MRRLIYNEAVRTIECIQAEIDGLPMEAGEERRRLLVKLEKEE